MVPDHVSRYFLADLIYQLLKNGLWGWREIELRGANIGGSSGLCDVVRIFRGNGRFCDLFGRDHSVRQAPSQFVPGFVASTGGAGGKRRSRSFVTTWVCRRQRRQRTRSCSNVQSSVLSETGCVRRQPGFVQVRKGLRTPIDGWTVPPQARHCQERASSWLRRESKSGSAPERNGGPDGTG